MNEQTVISLEHVSKSFRLPHERNNSVKSAIVNLHRSKRTYEKQQALKDISLEVKKGEFFGIVGRNGSGKSTLLKLLAGIYSQDGGNLVVQGSLTPFIELGVGFNPELTGRENIFLNGALLGFSRAEMADMYGDIVAFAELERFMDQKLKNYSSGMQVRLAFSIAVKVDSDILLLDEILAVGDAAFQKKCFDYFRELKRSQKTVVFISHDMNAVREYCDRAVLIEKGLVVHAGTAEQVAQHYTKLFMSSQAATTSVDGQGNRWGSGDVRIEKVHIKTDDSQVSIRVSYGFRSAVSQPIFGISIYSPTGTKVFEANTKWKRVKTGNFKSGQKTVAEWNIPNIFTNGTNYVTAAVADAQGLEFYDWWDEAASFIVNKELVTTALTLPEYEVTINAK